jgi:hypothetical protein
VQTSIPNCVGTTARLLLSERVVTFQEMTQKMNKSNIRFLGLASISMFVGLTPLACGSDDDGATNGGTSGKSGTAGTAGKSTSGGTAGKTGSGGSANVAGDATGGTAGEGGEGGAATVTKARVRVVHASPSAPSVDIYPKGSTTAAAEGVEYGAATDFIEVDAGTVAFELRAAGTDADEDAAFTTEDITLAEGTDYTLVAAGDFAQAAGADVAFRVLALEHDFEAPAASTAVARIVHATTAWDEVDLDVAATNGVDIPALARFGDESNVTIPAGVDLAVGFQTEAAGVLSELSVPKQTAGSELFVIATGNPGFPFRAPANGFALLVVDQDGKVSWVKENPWIHLAHASDISTVDVYETTHTAVAAKLTDDLAAAKLAAFQLPASATGFTLKAVAADAASGTATGLATGATSTLELGEHYLSYIAADTIQTVHEQFNLVQPTKVMLRGVHAATEVAATVDFGSVVSNALSGVLIDGVAPTESSAEAGIAINPGNIILGASAHSMTTLLAQKTLSGAAAASAAPVAGERDFVLIVGPAAANELWLIDTSVAGWSLR